MTSPEERKDEDATWVPGGVEEKELGPLGIGRKPVKDPLKQFNGMVTANGLTMEIITLALVLPMLRMVYEGSLWTKTNIIFVVALLLIHIGLFAFLRKPWVLTLILAVQIVGAAVGFFVHWAITALLIVYGLVWLLAVYLRSIIVERMRRGYLTTQHLEKP